MPLSFWERTTLLPHQDLIVVGAGITGIQAAIHAKRRFPHRSVMVLDRGVLPAGASTKNAGFACIGSLSEIAEDIHHIGEDRTFSLMERRYRGLQLLRESVPDSLLDYHHCGGVEVFSDKHDDRYVAASEIVDQVNQAIYGFSGLEAACTPWEQANTFPGFRIGWENTLEGQLNPGMMMKYLHGLAQTMGISLMNGVKVDSLDHREPGRILIFSDQLGELSADQIIIATNGFVRDLLPGLAVRPVRNQVLVTEEIPGLSWNGTFHHDRGYVYFRNVGNRVLLGGFRNLGGEAEETDQFGMSSGVFRHQMAFLREQLGIQAEVTHRWSGILGVGESREPLVTEIYPQVFVAVRLGGMGVALGSLLGKEVADLLS